MTCAQLRPIARGLAHAAGAGLAGALLVGLLPGLQAAEAAGAAEASGAAEAAGITPVGATDRELPPGRRVVGYTVRAGDTATALAVRFHAWTDELISYNHLGPRGTIYVGQRLRIPVVVAAVRKERRTTKPQRSAPAPEHRKHVRKHTWKPADPSRAKVRRVIVRTSRRQGVDPQLALAISWQEAGWQMHHVSSADAIGAMQVIPATGIWMSMYAGRPLRLHDVHDNVLAGVLLLKVLDDLTTSGRHQIAAYYQGLGAVREHGLYSETRRYVANVRAIQRRLEHGHSPA